MLEINGKNGISVKIVADSITAAGKRLTTFECVYPRIIHGEVMTHRMISKNSQSSRAVPLTSAVKAAISDPFMPVWWGKNQSGMSAKEELTDTELENASSTWLKLRDVISQYVTELGSLNLHKQIASRPLEAFQMHKVVLSGTEWNNVWWLRNHSAAQPEFQELAKCMFEAREKSVPSQLLVGEWHLPYVKCVRTSFGRWVYYDSNDQELDLFSAQKISASCSAQLSYRKSDDTLDKALDIYEKLIGMDRAHSSPFEHQGTPISLSTKPWSSDTWQDGITHVNKNGQLGSGNFYGWVQYRQLLPNHTKWG